MSSPLQLLRIDAHGLEAFQCHKRELTRLASFETGEFDRFAAWLQTQPHKVRYRVLADLVDERFEIETLPRIRGADRRALITRRLTNGFPDPSYAKAETLGIDRRAGTERLLFSGLARPARLQPWIAALHELGRAPELLASPSQLFAHFLPGNRPVLTVSFSRAGMRLTLIEAQQARLSRMVESADTDAVLHDSSWQLEIDRTLHYATTHRAEQDGRTPRVVVVAPAMDLSRGGTATGSGEVAPKHLAPSELGAPPITAAELDASHVAPPAIDSSALLLHWLSRAPGTLGWSGPSPGHTANLRLGAALALGASALLLVAGLSLATHHWHVSKAATNELAKLKREITHLQREHNALSAAHAILDAKPAQIIDTVRQINAERNSALDPLALLTRLANAFAKHPELELQTLAWSPLPQSSQPPASGAPSSLSPAPTPNLAQVKLTLAPGSPTHPNPALDALVNHLEAEGAQDVLVHTRIDGIARIELQLPAPFAAESDR